MIKELAKSLREYKKTTVLTPIMMVGEVSCECIIPLFTKELINSIVAMLQQRGVSTEGIPERLYILFKDV